MLRLFALAAGNLGAQGTLGWPTGAVRHAFFDTPHGQLHYVAGAGSAGPTVVHFHGHPSSTVEFKYIGAELGLPFVAIDWFGMGLSEDFAGDGFCTFPEMGALVLELLRKEGVKEFVASGNLKGAHPALALAAQAPRKPGPLNQIPWTRKLVLLNPLILSPQGKSYIEKVFIPKIEAARMYANGSHVQDAWKDPSSAPMYMGVLPDDDRDIVTNTQKTLDNVRQFSTGVLYQKAWVAYNDENEPALAAFDPDGWTLVAVGEAFLTECASFGLDTAFSLNALGKALTHRHNATSFIHGAGQGMAIQNATLLAGLIKDLVSVESIQIV